MAAGVLALAKCFNSFRIAGWALYAESLGPELGSAMSRTYATAEVERNIVDPGQARACKVGALTIQRLRKRAELALGFHFDVRMFHRQVRTRAMCRCPCWRPRSIRGLKRSGFRVREPTLVGDS
jgi:uncharacterized protein (DUF885 family)